MDLLPIYTTETLYFCYSMRNGKMYNGEQKAFKPNLLYFLGICLIPIISENIDILLVDLQSRSNIYMFLCAFGIIGGVLAGSCCYIRIAKKLYEQVEEMFLSKEQINEYILKGKSQFRTQVIIVAILLVCGLGILALALLKKKFVFCFIEFVLWFCIALIVLWLKLGQRIRLIKMTEKHKRS